MDGEVVIGTRLDTKQFDRQIEKVEREIADYERQLSKAKELGFSSGDVDDLNLKLEKAKNKLISLNKQKEKLNQPTSFGAEIQNISKGLTRTISKVGKWALAVFGVRSAYMLVRQATSTLAESNDEIAGKLEGIRTFIAVALEPVVTRLLDLVYKLMSYVNYLAKAWFGVDLFAKASALSMKNGAKSAEKMRKSLAGFDEMNILGDNTASAGSGISGNEFPVPEDVPIPKWLEWIKNNKDIVISALAGITAGLLALKFGANGILALGIGVAVAGLIKLIKDVIKFIKDPSWNNFANILADLAILLGGVALAFIAVDAVNPVGWIILLIAVIALLVAAIIKNWDFVKELLTKAKEWVVNIFKMAVETILNWITFLSTTIGGIITALVGLILSPFIALGNSIKDLFNGLLTIITGVFNVIKGIFTGDMKTVLNGFKQIFKGVFDSLWSIVKYPLNMIIEGINSIIRGANKIRIDIPSWVPGLGGKQFGINIKTLPKLASGAIINQPGRGVPIGTRAIGGEAGAEGIIPLTDSQAMETLGEAIGRYITINANITNSMNGRIISRELQKINNQNNFAYNM